MVKTSRPVAKLATRYDVVILGAGLAGLTLARQLLRETDASILLVDRRAELPNPHQKVGEATVQLSGYYFARVLDLEDHLLHEHLPKYNLRFHWPTAGRANRDLEDLSQAYIRTFSNIMTYQLDRNTLEQELLRLNREDPRCRIEYPVRDLEVDLDDVGRHRVRFAAGGRVVEVGAGWVVDASGRGRFLARRLGLARRNAIRHGAYFFWLDGVLDVERLTGLDDRARRLKPDRRFLGHSPALLATNHFCGEGFWFWVIPLRHKTSLGLVFDTQRIRPEDVSSLDKLLAWVEREYPLFARELRRRQVREFSGIRDFSHGCVQTISERGWGMSGEAGRFLDPLYSPGSDFIALHNTLLVDAIKTRDGDELAAKCRRHEQLLRALYEGFMPSFAASYDVLGDPEAYYFKYVWELSVYFGFYVFPFLNDFFADGRFQVTFLNRFSRLGRLNHQLLSFLNDFYHWKKANLAPLASPVFVDFTALQPLAEAERTFYEVGVTIPEARGVLDRQLANLRDLARLTVAHVAARVADAPGLVRNRTFVESIDLDDIRFDAAELAARAATSGGGAPYVWPFDISILERFWTPRRAVRSSRPRRAARQGVR